MSRHDKRRLRALMNAGPLEKTQDVLSIQPVIAVPLGPTWNPSTRTILPVISQSASNLDWRAVVVLPTGGPSRAGRQASSTGIS